jgi:hypothetical protein
MKVRFVSLSSGHARDTQNRIGESHASTAGSAHLGINPDYAFPANFRQ